MSQPFASLSNLYRVAVVQRCSLKKVFIRPAILLKKRPWHRFFPANFVKFLRTPAVAASADEMQMVGRNQFFFQKS